MVECFNFHINGKGTSNSIVQFIFKLNNNMKMEGTRSEHRYICISACIENITQLLCTAYIQ